MRTYTKYQQKRRFIAKINARIKSLVSRAGVDVDELTGQLEEFNGVWITNPKTGTINIKTDVFDNQLIEEIEALIPTYIAEVDRATAEFAESDRPEPTEEQIHRNIRAKFTFVDDFNKTKEKYYEWVSKQNEVTIQATQEYNALKDALSDFGSRWHSGMLNTQDKLDQLEVLNSMGFNDYTKILSDKINKKM